MSLYGMPEENMIRCDKCKKLMAAKGIKLRVVEQGEYQVQYFACPHCGATYQVVTTDAEQRRLIAARLAELEKRAVAVKQKFRQKTIERHWRKAKEIEKRIDERAEALRTIGEGVLHPEEGKNGPINDQGGVAKL